MFIPEVSSIERQVADLNNAPGNVPQDLSIKNKRNVVQVLYLKRQLRDLRAKLSSRFIEIDRLKEETKERLSNSLLWESSNNRCISPKTFMKAVIDTSGI